MYVENEINDLNINSTFEEIGSPFSKTRRTHNLRNRKKIGYTGSLNICFANTKKLT